VHYYAADEKCKVASGGPCKAKNGQSEASLGSADQKGGKKFVRVNSKKTGQTFPTFDQINLEPLIKCIDLTFDKPLCNKVTLYPFSSHLWRSGGNSSKPIGIARKITQT